MIDHDPHHDHHYDPLIITLSMNGPWYMMHALHSLVMNWPHFSHCHGVTQLPHLSSAVSISMQFCGRSSSYPFSRRDPLCRPVITICPWLSQRRLVVVMVACLWMGLLAVASAMPLSYAALWTRVPRIAAPDFAGTVQSPAAAARHAGPPHLLLRHVGSQSNTAALRSSRSRTTHHTAHSPPNDAGIASRGTSLRHPNSDGAQALVRGAAACATVALCWTLCKRIHNGRLQSSGTGQAWAAMAAMSGEQQMEELTAAVQVLASAVRVSSSETMNELTGIRSAVQEISDTLERRLEQGQRIQRLQWAMSNPGLFGFDYWISGAKYNSGDSGMVQSVIGSWMQDYGRWFAPNHFLERSPSDKARSFKEFREALSRQIGHLTGVKPRWTEEESYDGDTGWVFWER